MKLKYSFPTKKKATSLIKALLSDEDKNTDIHNVSVTKYTDGLLYMDKVGDTYDVDVVWKDFTKEEWEQSPLKEWADEKFIVSPKSPNHTWA